MRLLTALSLAALLSSSGALAATNTMTASSAAKPAAAKPAPAKSAAATTATPKPAPAKMAAAKPAPKPAVPDAEKKAISKACSDQANAQNLHGKAREKFRSECKRKGGEA